jgi:hypothetical protein
MTILNYQPVIKAFEAGLWYGSGIQIIHSAEATMYKTIKKQVSVKS